MFRNLAILLAAAAVIALPFLFRRAGEVSDWRAGDPVLVIISPHDEAIRYEFAQAFSRWHREQYGQPVKVDWRAIGGTSEISRYLAAAFTSAARAWWTGQGRDWPAGAAEVLLDRKFDTKTPPADPAAVPRWEVLSDLHRQFRATDDPAAFTSDVDLFFGGGEYDHRSAFQQGLTVPPWPEGAPPAGLFTAEDGTELITAKIGGETWRTATLFGNAVSTFGICYNLDRLRELGLPVPARWEDLADPRYVRQLGVADPTKSGSIAKAFELIIHQQCQEAVRAAGFAPEDVDRFEAAIAAAKLPPGAMPEGVPAAYQEAVERGWLAGVRLVQRIGANARYFTDSAGKVPVDVSAGNAAAGLAIDFYGRFQAQYSRAPDGSEHMGFVTPEGGSGASCDPISLLRGAPHRELASRFIEFTLRDEGQRLWTYRPGTPGGPEKFALRRVPIHRAFFPSATPWVQAAHTGHLAHAADDLADPRVNPYELAKQFVYRPRWTGSHFGVHRDLVRAMCLDSSDELRAAWLAILAAGGPDRNPAAMEAFGRMPDAPRALDWRSAPELAKQVDRLELLRLWTAHFRASYRRAAELARGEGTP